MPNRLAREVSPYLRQHMDNPVDWYPWGEEAFARARAEEKPILLSVGYAACHWCHVMERDAFEVPEVAERMNRSFVSVKVDREERPDVDQLYQGVVQLMGRGGGWPLTVFLTPEGRPFFGGTYFPPEDRHGLPAFSRILDALADAWATRRDEVLASASSFEEGLEELSRHGLPAPPSAWRPEDLERAATRMLQDADPRHGGFHGAPKFPNAMDLAFLLREGGEEGREHVRRSLRAMARGGIHDPLGGGFHRYSVDARWAVPHFEKMLYDNALLVRLYAEGAVALAEPAFADVARGIFAWMEREMADPRGGWFSSQDADSEGEEGRFFTWTPEQVHEVLGAGEGALLCEHLGVTAAGNFEGGTTVLHVARTAAEIAASRGEPVGDVERRLAAGRLRLREARDGRVHPATDDKVLASWNGLAIGGLAAAGRLLGDDAMIGAAARAAGFVLGTLEEGGALRRVYRGGVARQPAFLDDHAHLAEGLVELFAATGEARWLDAARAELAAIAERFHDAGAFFLSPREGEELLHRQPSVHDGAVPAGASSAVHAMLAVRALTGDDRSGAIAEAWLAGQRDAMLRSPLAFGHLLCAASLLVRGVTEVAVIGRPGPERDALLAAARRGFRPEVIAFAAAEGPGELLAGRGEVGGQPAAYVCRAFACEAPRTDPAELSRALGEAR